MHEPVDVAVLGATGMVGEQLVSLLDEHPWFRLAEVGASDRSAGDRLGDRIASSGAVPLSERTADLRLSPVEGPWRSPILLSALPSGVAGDLEPALARAGHLVVSNASSHRQGQDVPLVVPEINPDHLTLLEAQKERWTGGLVTNPNCVVAGTVMALAPLHRALGVETVVMTTFQAISGAGRPGPAAGDLMDNVLPYIAGEEEKMGREIRKILGTAKDDRVEPAEITVSATSTRVPVLHGHLASLSIGFRDRWSPDDVVAAIREFRSPVASDRLPLAPDLPLEYLPEEDRPQPRVDRDRGAGMTVTVGRVRPCEVHDVKLFALSHNLVRGAAGAALLNAELCRARGWLDRMGQPGLATPSSSR